MDAFLFVIYFLSRKICSSNTSKRTTSTPKTDPIIIAVLLFDKAVTSVAAFVAAVTVGVDAFSQKLVMEAFLSNWQIAYCTELQRVQVAL